MFSPVVVVSLVCLSFLLTVISWPCADDPWVLGTFPVIRESCQKEDDVIVGRSGG